MGVFEIQDSRHAVLGKVAFIKNEQLMG